jgi:hypothetical protein
VVVVASLSTTLTTPVVASVLGQEKLLRVARRGRARLELEFMLADA